MTVNVKTNNNGRSLAETNQLPNDSGWITASLGRNFTSYGGDLPKYRKIGNIVSIVGSVKPTVSNIGENTNSYEILTLPVGYRPPIMDLVYICQGSGICTWMMIISTNGVVSFSRYREGGRKVGASTTEWLPFSATFMV